MPLSSLATVELQLIMHACDKRSLLALARCSRFTLHAASSDFAWRCLSPLRIFATLPSLGARLSSSLLRHCDVHLMWHPNGPLGSRCLPATPAQQLVLAAVPRVRALDTRGYEAAGRTLLHEHVAELIPRMPTGSLTALYVQDSIPSLAELVRQQPNLRTLHFRVSVRRIDEPQYLSPLSELPSLTDLGVSVIAMHGAVLPAASRCPSLRRLHLHALMPPSSRESQLTWVAQLAAHPLPLLEELSMHMAYSEAQQLLDEFAGAAPLPEQWPAAFAALPSLQLLTLRECAKSEVVMDAAARACPQLRRVHVRSHAADALLHLPSLPAVRELLLRHPLLSLHLSLTRALTPVKSRAGLDACNRIQEWEAEHGRQPRRITIQQQE